MAATAVAEKQKGFQPGELFGFPGITRSTEQPDNNSFITTTLASAATASPVQQPLVGQVPFKQTDIVFAWRYDVIVTQAYTTGTSTQTASQYFPYNIMGQFKLTITNLYDLIDVQSGIDLAIFNAYRPYLENQHSPQNTVYATPAAWPYTPEANNVTSGSYTLASTSLRLPFVLPACIWFDEYFELDSNGRTQAVASRLPVSPLYMSGTARDIFPQITFNPGLAANTDQGPAIQSAGTGTTGPNSIQHDFRRVGMYGTTNPPEMPTVWNWRYCLVSKRVALGAVSQVDIPAKTTVNNGGGGQILSVFFRFYDPSVTFGTVVNGGAPIAISTIANAQLLYGSSLIKFNDTYQMNQRRAFEQHNLRLPVGVWLWDMALDQDGRISNAWALNLYTTDVTYHFNFGSTLSSTAYVVVGTEYLSYIVDQPTLM